MFGLVVPVVPGKAELEDSRRLAMQYYRPWLKKSSPLGNTVNVVRTMDRR